MFRAGAIDVQKFATLREKDTWRFIRGTQSLLTEESIYIPEINFQVLSSRCNYPCLRIIRVGQGWRLVACPSVFGRMFSREIRSDCIRRTLVMFDLSMSISSSIASKSSLHPAVRRGSLPLIPIDVLPLNPGVGRFWTRNRPICRRVRPTVIPP